MAVYQPVMVVSDDGTVISLRSIESMNFVRTNEDETVDKLRDDCAVVIVTKSGRQYEISMKRQVTAFGKGYSLSKDAIELRTAIFERWVSFIS